MSRALAHTKAKYSEIIGKTILMRKVKKLEKVFYINLMELRCLWLIHRVLLKPVESRFQQARMYCHN